MIEDDPPRDPAQTVILKLTGDLAPSWPGRTVELPHQRAVPCSGEWASVYSKLSPKNQLLIESYSKAREVGHKHESLDSKGKV